MADVISSVNNTDSNSPRKLNVGILAVPDKIEKPVLYNALEAKKKFNVLTSDIYEAEEKVTYESITKTPKGVIALGVALVAGVIAVKTGAYAKIKNVMMAIFSRLKAH